MLNLFFFRMFFISDPVICCVFEFEISGNSNGLPSLRDRLSGKGSHSTVQDSFILLLLQLSLILIMDNSFDFLMRSLIRPTHTTKLALIGIRPSEFLSSGFLASIEGSHPNVFFSSCSVIFIFIVTARIFGLQIDPVTPRMVQC